MARPRRVRASTSPATTTPTCASCRYVVNKVDAIREDSGSVGEVFDAAFQRRFIEAADEAEVTADARPDSRGSAKGRAEVPRDATTGVDARTPKRRGRASSSSKASSAELDLSPDTLRDTLDVALRIGLCRCHARSTDQTRTGAMRLSTSLPADWQAVVDETLRLHETVRAARCRCPALVFDPASSSTSRWPSGLPAPARTRRSCTSATRCSSALWPRSPERASPALTAGGVAMDCASRPCPGRRRALVLLTVEELAVNELRESFHHWVRTLRFPSPTASSARRSPHAPALRTTQVAAAWSPADVERARELWDDVERDVRDAAEAS